jgi:large subunit ribosomal protein L18
MIYMRHEHQLTIKQLRANRVRKHLKDNVLRLRLHVFRSNRHLYAQIIDDQKRRTLLGVSENQLKITGTKTAKAQALGSLIAGQAKTKHISAVAFDRGAYKYHGRIKAFAEAAREAGLVF